MAITKSSATGKSAPAGKTAKSAVSLNAIDLLEADHREVDADFRTYEDLTSDAEKLQVAARICLALKVHAAIEEEIFYPAAREATSAFDTLDEALVEHTGAKTLVAQIEATRPGMPLYDARVKVLGEQVRHHVQEEETELFPAVRESGLDLDALGARLAARKAELMALWAPASVA